MTYIVHHHTTKTSEGFEFVVSKIGYGVPTVRLKAGICTSRAIATRLAKKWKMYFKPQVAAGTI